MKQLNKKAAECTAIHPTARITNQSRLVKLNVTQNTELEKFSIEEAIRISGVNQKDFTDFFLLRGYIRKESYGYSATALGIEKGCVINDDKYNALYTMEAIIRVSSAMAA